MPEMYSDPFSSFLLRCMTGTWRTCILLVALTAACSSVDNRFELPRLIQLGASVDSLRPLFAEDCTQVEESHYTGEMAAPFTDQVQVNCDQLEIFGGQRDAELMFNDGPLGHVWIHISQDEADEVLVGLQREFGKVVFETDDYKVFASGTVALRRDPPEVLVATQALTSELTGYNKRDD